MTTRLRILRLLADGGLHSGEDIGRRLGITRAAVAKGVKSLGASGLPVQAAAGQGYRLGAPLTPLDGGRIMDLLGGALEPPARIEVFEQVDSTNRYLLEQALAAGDPSGRVCLTEVQAQGRGRRGRSWVATPYHNLMMSSAWRFALGPGMVAGLSLAAGVAVLRALEAYGCHRIGLKWPNDILWSERKLAGLLIDVHGEASGPCTVVLGIGVNCHIAPADAERIDQPWTDLFSITGEVPDRNRLAALLIAQLHDMFRTFAASGLAAFRSDWNRCHLYTDKRVRVHQGDATYEGTVEGIDAAGALRVRTVGGETRLLHSGEVSLRLVS